MTIKILCHQKKTISMTIIILLKLREQITHIQVLAIKRLIFISIPAKNINKSPKVLQNHLVVNFNPMIHVSTSQTREQKTSLVSMNPSTQKKEFPLVNSIKLNNLTITYKRNIKQSTICLVVQTSPKMVVLTTPKMWLIKSTRM